jgi:hypothetical protein
MKHERKSGFLVANIAPTLCKVQFYPFVMTDVKTFVAADVIGKPKSNERVTDS